ncbi:DUF2341 domain-containing protein [Thermofilum pendens]|uniref:DUF2341 domain-containing protein n=1 Tax=Thermofilum pendens (strain DSM 2475 / Hrk 5) TaxID=368408 RepID=A1S0E2_THEPD|nr:DUF2341 domain-containing protein [Thermofilum pendens]ABL78922.1 hypothetical protein Tpen_1526 [Thermofilum pendens Hrk 5]
MRKTVLALSIAMLALAGAYAAVTIINLTEWHVQATQPPVKKLAAYGVKRTAAYAQAENGLNVTYVEVTAPLGCRVIFDPALVLSASTNLPAKLYAESVTGNYAFQLSVNVSLGGTQQVQVVSGSITQSAGAPVSVQGSANFRLEVLVGSGAPLGSEVARLYTWLYFNASTSKARQKIVWVFKTMSWLYCGWLYRKGHDIVGSTAGAVSGYQVRLRVCSGSGTDSGDTVYLNGKGRADFGDLRFSYLQPDGREVAIPYWVESVSGGCATVWVKVPSIPASPGTARIYVYYGNPSATSESNGAATFIYFNDFSSAIGFTSFPYDKGADGWGDVDGSDSSGWQLFQGALKHRVTVDASHMYALTDVQNGNVAVCVLINLGKLEEIEEAGVAARHSVDANGYIRQYYARLIYAPSLIDSLTFRPRVNVELVKSTGLPSEVEPVHVYYSLQANTWYKLEMRLYGGHITVYVDDSKVIDWTDSSPITSGSRLGLFSAYNKNVDHLYDNFYVRNYVEPEPSHGQWLPEETDP